MSCLLFKWKVQNYEYCALYHKNLPISGAGKNFRRFSDSLCREFDSRTGSLLGMPQNTERMNLTRMKYQDIAAATPAFRGDVQGAVRTETNTLRLPEET